MQYWFTQQEHGDFHFFPLPLMAFPSALTTDSRVSGTRRTPNSSGELGGHLFLISSSSRCFSSKAKPLAVRSSENGADACRTAGWRWQDPCNRRDTMFILQSTFLLPINSPCYGIYPSSRFMLRQEMGEGRGGISSCSCIKPQRRCL